MVTKEGKLKACAYVRVSTRSENQQHSLKEQIEYWEHYLKSSPEYEFVKVYSDYGYSGKINNRPSYRKMIQDALNGKIDIIFTKSISRFGRNVTTLLDDIHKLRDRNIFVEFESENINTKNNAKDLYLTIYTAFAENELLSTSEAIKFGFNNKFKTGSMLCKPILGYKIKKDGDDYIFTVIPKQAETVQLIFNLYNSGKTFTEIAAYLTEHNVLNKKGTTVWHAPMIPYILSNEKYIGAVYSQKYYNRNFKTYKNNIDNPAANMYVIEKHHEPIISNKMFLKAKKRLDSRVKRKYNKRPIKYDILKDVLFCEKCGNPYKRVIRKNTKGEEVITYRCGKNRYKSECCHNSTVYQHVFEHLFTQAYNKFRKIRNNGTPECEKLNAMLAHQSSLLNDLQKTYRLGNITYPDFCTEHNELLKEYDKINNDLNTTLKHIVNGKRIPLMAKQFKTELMNKTLEKAIVSNSTITFVFNNGISIEKELINRKTVEN